MNVITYPCWDLSWTMLVKGDHWKVRPVHKCFDTAHLHFLKLTNGSPEKFRESILPLAYIFTSEKGWAMEFLSDFGCF